MAKLALLAPREEMLEQARRVSAETGMELFHMEAITSKNAAERALHAVELGAEILIARGHQASVIRMRVDVPVVEIMMTAQEMGLLVLRAKELFGKSCPRIGIVGYANMFCDMSCFDGMYGVELHDYFVDHTAPNEEAIEGAVRRAIDDRIDLIIGGDIATACARRAGISSFFLSSTIDSMREALRIAQRVAYAVDLEKKNTAELQTLLDNTFCIVARLDETGRILIVNHIAETLLGWKPQQVIGRSISELADAVDDAMLRTVLGQGQEIYSSFIRIGRVSLVANLAPVKDGETITGAIFSCQEVSHVEEMGVAARQELYEQGYVATCNFTHFPRHSALSAEVIGTAKIYAQSDAPVLITGETGTEQELLAQSIHNASPRKSGPFVAARCGALSGREQARILFGASGGEEQFKGLAALAHGGTFYLNSVDRLDAVCQARLLQILRKGVVVGSGSRRPLPVDVRVIADSARDLALLVERGEFSEALYYALNTLGLELPALRERPDDIALWAESYVMRFSERYNRYLSLTRGAVDRMRGFGWNGNLMQLKGFCERLVLTAQRRYVDENFVEHLYYKMYPRISHKRPQEKVVIYKDPEAAKIAELLEKHGGNRSAVAAELGISTTTLWRKIKKYDIGQKYEA